MNRSKQWAIRCMHEASLHENNCFITLTFSEAALWTRDNPGSICKEELKRFLHRLRVNIKRKDPNYTEGEQPFRYFACGEYGEKTQRPHYHVLIFGWTPPDKQPYKLTKAGHQLYTSEFLETTWGHGFAPVGDVTFDSASYTARYCLKKITGENAEEHYKWVDSQTGEIRDRQAEFAVMSRRPGIGAIWLEQNMKDVYPADHVIVKGTPTKPPKYYDNLFERTDPLGLEDIKLQRFNESHYRDDKPDEDRLITMHLSHWKRQQNFVRETEPNDSTRIHNLRQQSESIPKAILHAQQRYSYTDAAGDRVPGKGS